MNNAKIWILVTGIVVIVSGFLLYSTVRSRETEKAAFMVKIQELNGRVNQLDGVQQELEQAKKERAGLEAKTQSDIAALESQLADSKKSEALLKSKIDTLAKEKESMTKYIENSNAIVAKLNKKIEALEKERDRLIAEAQKEFSEPAFRYVDPINETPQEPAATPKIVMGAKLAEEEIVDLGRIIVHPATQEAARVEHVNPLYGFVVLSAGSKDGLRKDSVVNITRNNRLVAKVVIKKVREDVASAVTLPEWTREEIRVGDMVSINAPSPLPAP